VCSVLHAWVQVHDGFPVAGDVSSPALATACADIQKQIRLWGPVEYEKGSREQWSCFYIPHAVLVAAGVGAADAPLDQVIATVFDAPTKPYNAKGRGRS
jgi:hypothetical protein